MSSFFLKLLNTVTRVLLRSSIKIFLFHAVRAMKVTNRNEFHGIKRLNSGRDFCHLAQTTVFVFYI
jgi:hypothetical protein